MSQLVTSGAILNYEFSHLRNIGGFAKSPNSTNQIGLYAIDNESDAHVSRANYMIKTKEIMRELIKKNLV
jgi:hypothetical protein